MNAADIEKSNNSLFFMKKKKTFPEKIPNRMKITANSEKKKHIQ